VFFVRQQHRLRLSLLAVPAALALAAGAVGAVPDANVAACDQAMLGHGEADWRSESRAAGPVGVPALPLSQMSQSRQGLTAKMPILVEGRAPERVTVSVPPALRKRVFLYYGRVIGRDGKPTTLFTEARGYSETEFELCANKPRTIWPGGVRVKGRAPVYLLVEVEGAEPLRLRLGRPRVFRGLAS
jgi:hypothetical protein